MDVVSSRASGIKAWQAYIVAFLATAATFVLRLALDHPLDGQPILVIFTLPIMLSAYLGGLRAGLLATALTFFGASYYLLPPFHSFAIASGAQRWQQFFITLAGIFISVLSEGLHRARRRADMVSRELKQGEAALRVSEKKLFSVLENMSEGVMLVDPSGNPYYQNPACLRIHGFEPGAAGIINDEDLVVSWKVWDELGHPLDLNDWPLSRLVRGEHIQDQVIRARRDATNHEFVAIYNGRPIYDNSGKIAFSFITIEEITERKRAEQTIRSSEEYFRFLNDLVEATRKLAEPAQIMVVMARMLGIHLRASRCAYADVESDGEQFTILHDYTDGCESTVGRYRLSLFGARAVATLQRGQTLIIRNVATELLPGDGADMFNAIGIQAIITCPLVKEGRLRALMAVHQAMPRDWQPNEIALVQDVVERCWATIERRAAEQKIYELNAGLEQRVIERTMQLEVANKELESFSYSVSHDLRAPLRGIHSFVGMIQEDYADRLDAEGKRMLDIVSREAKRMGVLIDDLLAFSRLGRQQMERTLVNMDVLARSVFETLVAAAPLSAVKIRFDLGHLPRARGDLALLRQVFANLIGNAIKYSSKQLAPAIEVRGWSSGGELTYYIKDNGVGFDEKYSHNLFGVFQRLHSEQEFEGTGVGLAIVQRVIHRHGGKVRAESKPGEGATFYFTLPATEPEP